MGSWKVLGVLGLVALMALANGALAADNSLRTELSQAQKEIAELRAELAEMRDNSAWQYQQQLADAMGPAPRAAAAGGGQIILPAGWSIKPYGYIKADAIYDDSAHPTQNLCGWALPENQVTRGDDQFTVTARQTRLGAVITAPNIGDAKVRGVIETDFYGPDNGNDNSAALRIRRAFGEVKGPDWMLLFGQEWEIMSPLFPDTLNFMYGALSGNMGFRYPQIRLDKWWILENEGKLIGQVALQREMPQDLDGFGVEDGRDSGLGTALARVGYHQGKFQAGFSGHFGHEEVDWDHLGDDDDLHTWSINADLRVPLWQALQVQGEVYLGENLDCHTGNLNGVNVGTRDPIEALGGWVELGWKPKPAAGEIAGNVGFGWVDPRNSDVPDGWLSQNQYYYVNAKYYFSSYLWTGVEISYYQTDYENADDGDNVRIQNSWVLTF